MIDKICQVKFASLFPKQASICCYMALELKFIFNKNIQNSMAYTATTSLSRKLSCKDDITEQ